MFGRRDRTPNGAAAGAPVPAIPVSKSGRRESARVTANRIAKRAHLENADRIRLREVVMAAERGWYGSRGSGDSAVGVVSTTGGHRTVGADGGSVGSATTILDRPQATAGPDLVAGVRSVIGGLDASVPVRWSDRVLPRSLRRTAG